MFRFRRFSYGLLVALSVACGLAHAQNIAAPIEDEVRQRLRVNTNINPLGENPFGENVNLYNGTLSFEQTDINLQGTGPDITVTRKYAVADTTAPWWRQFVDWSMEIPHIETMTTPNLTSFFISPSGGRCSGIGTGPSDVVFPNQLGGPAIGVDPSAWWYGVHLDIPGMGQQDLIVPESPNTRPLPRASLNGGQVVQASLITRNNWAIACLPSTSNGAGGEGFLAISPGGTQYYLDRLVYKRANNYGTSPYEFTRNVAMMMVSKVVDRFGNTLTYNYDSNNNLTSVVASDGRSVAFSYTAYTIQPTLELSNPDPGFRVNAATVTASNGATRTWTYSYESGSYGDLQSVTLPDGSSWQFSLDNFREYEDVPDLDMITYNASGAGNCTYALEPQNAVTATGTITHPSGLVGTFTTKNTIRGESYVQYDCAASQSNEYLYYRNVMAYPSLIKKTFSGAGLPGNLTWTYSYSSPNQSWSTDSCASNNTCASTVYTDAVDPNGNDVRYTFSNRWDATESQLLDASYYQGAAGSTLLRDIQTSYASSSTGPWPASLGISLGGEANGAEVLMIEPLNRKSTVQQGDSYTWQAVAFDLWANPTDTKRYNSIAGQPSIEELHSYLYDSNLWVMGLPVSTVNAATSEVESSDAYNASDLVASRSRFGELLESYTYDNQGNLSTFKDGDGNTTSLSDYYRGIPQQIAYPDGTSSSAVVDDFGEVTSETDQRGYATSYSYDPVGRVTRVTYPTNDTVSWNPEIIAYNFVNSAEQGIAAGHWDRVETVGTASSTTYFDAELRPLLTYTVDTNVAGSGNSVTFAYDWTGAKTFASFPVAGAPGYSAISSGIHNSYDALERLTLSQEDSELGSLSTSTSYLQGGGRQVTSPNGNVTTTYYQDFDAPSYDSPISISAPQGVSQSISRNVYGDPTAITQSGPYGSENDSVTKTFVYDIYHRVCRTTEPESGSTVIAYDAANNVQWTAQGQSITDGTCGQADVATSAQMVRTYDQLNRIRTVIPPTGTQSTTYSYDNDGNLLTATSGIASQAFAYDSRNLMTSEALAVPGFTWALAYSYDGNGHLNAIGYPDIDGVNEGVAYNPDALGRPLQAGSYASGVTYFPNGVMSGFNFADGLAFTASQNARDLPSGFSYFTGNAVDVSEALTYDNDANITHVTDNVSGQRSKAFTYDTLDRLTNAVAGQLYGTETYQYDAINNLRSRLTAGTTLTLNYDSTNRLASVAEGASVISQYSYDSQGDRSSVTSGGVTTQYTFDAENQLLQVSGIEGYAYDAAGRRVAKTSVAGTPTYYYLYSHSGRLMFSFDPTNLTATNYIYLGSKLIARHAMTALTAPSAISVSSTPNNGNFALSWGTVPDATSYTVQERINGGAWNTIYTGDNTSLAVSGRAGGSYLYQVRGCTSNGCSAWTVSSTVGVWPAIPVVSVPGGTDNGPYIVSWTASPGATGYAVQESLNGGAWSTIATSQVGTSIARPGTTSGNYTYQVAASNGFGSAGWSTTSATVVVDTTFGPAPSPVPTLSVPSTNNNGSPSISWTAATPITEYTLQQSTNAGATWTQVYAGTNTSVTLSGLSTGSYLYQLQACYMPGDGSACTGWVQAGPMVVTIPPSGIPTISSPAVTTSGNFTVSWSGVSTATSYVLQQQTNGGGWTTIQNSAATSHAVSGAANASYGFRVEACNGGGCGGWSSTASTTVEVPPASAPALSGGGTSTNGSYSMSWNAVANATSYTLQESVNGGGWGTVQANGATSWSTSGRGDGTYQYRVEACDAGGCSGWSATATEAVTLPPGTPALSTPKGIVSGTYSVTWSSVATATSYTLQQQANGGAWTTVQSGPINAWSAFGEANGTYGYRVQACYESACSAWSATANVLVGQMPGQ